MLTVSNLSKDFGGLNALRNLDLKVKKGIICSVIGPNGAGKTTLFNLITGFYWPTYGDIEFRGQKIIKFPPYRLTSLGMARTFQTASYFSDKTVKENLLVATHTNQRIKIWDILARTSLFKNEEKNIRLEADSIIEFLGINIYRNQLAKEIPTAIKQLLAIGMALMTKPVLLLLDEPSGGMTSEEVKHLMLLIKKIKSLGITVIIIEHRMRMVMGISDWIMVLNFGEKIAEGSPKEIIDNKTVIEAYLGKEYVA